MASVAAYSASSVLRKETLVDILQWRAENRPTSVAYKFLMDGEHQELVFTYGELDRCARAVGATLQKFVEKSDRVLLVYPHGAEFIPAFFGTLYSGAIAVPAYPPSTGRSHVTLLRLLGIIRDCSPRVALTSGSMLQSLDRWSHQYPELRNIRWIATDNITLDVGEKWKHYAASYDTLAFLQYTSGSTASPKGVMVSYRNLLDNEKLIEEIFHHTEKSIFVSWLPLYHDMGLIGNLLHTMYIGAPCILMAPVSFLMRPARWLHAISRHKGVISGGPNFAYDLCLAKASNQDLSGIDLSSWEVAFNGAEPVRHETMRRFAEAFAECGFRYQAFYPSYGLAEATLLVSGGVKADLPVTISVQTSALEDGQIVTVPSDAWNSRTLVGSGRVWSGQEIAIVDPVQAIRCAPDRVGEIWISTPAAARGYWRRPEESERVFQAWLSDTGEGPYLRTGDLGFVVDGELFITGRLKDLIIICGRNLYPQDIEMTVEKCHAMIRSAGCAAFSIDRNGQEQLIVVAEIEGCYRAVHPSKAVESGLPDLELITARIRKSVAEEHEVHVHTVVFITIGSLPKTSSAKLQRGACRAAFLEKTLSVVIRD